MVYEIVLMAEERVTRLMGCPIYGGEGCGKTNLKQVYHGLKL